MFYTCAGAYVCDCMPHMPKPALLKEHQFVHFPFVKEQLFNLLLKRTLIQLHKHNANCKNVKLHEALSFSYMSLSCHVRVSE